MNLPTKVRGFLKIHVANVSLLYHYIIQMNFQFLCWDTIYHIKEFSLTSLLVCVCIAHPIKPVFPNMHRLRII